MTGKAKQVEPQGESVRQHHAAETVRLDPLLLPPETESLALQRAMVNPGAAAAGDILALQHAAGNQAVHQLIQAKAIIATKLTVGATGDRYEQEADRVAEQVVGQQRAAGGVQDGVQRQEEEEELQTKRLAATITPLVQRQEEEEKAQTKPLVQRQQDEEEIQAKLAVQRVADGSFEVARGFEDRLAAHKGGGNSLPDETRAFMEPRFGADFSGVRVHTGADAAQLNRQISAQAFTHGQDIYLGAGRYNPSSESGKRLLAHELTHVVQQVGANKLQRRAGADTVQIQCKLPADRISAKLMHLDFVRMKRKETHIAQMLLSKLKLVREPDDAYGHWWTEIGDLKSDQWRPVESYGWWPAKGVNIWSTLKGVKGMLNRGNAKQDPHHGDDASYFHPVMDVGDDEKYEDVYNRVANSIRSFAGGFKGKWSWRLGWGKNCHTFQEKLMNKIGLKKAKVAAWLKKPLPEIKKPVQVVGRKFTINTACDVVGLDDMSHVGGLDAGDVVDVLDPKFESGYDGNLIPIAFEELDEQKKGRVSDWYLDKV